MKKIDILILSFIFAVGTFFRIVSLDKIPVGLTIDELAAAYNSYSILKTGKDEHSVFMPLQFRSVGDYKPPVLIYTMIPAIAVFGLTEFGTRITIAVIGSLTVLLVFFLIKELTKNKYIALLTAFSVAISPWHIKFSRSTFEAILALFFVLLGTYVFLRFIEGQTKKLWLSSIIFALSILTYHSEKVFTPLFAIGLFFIYKDNLLKFKKQLFTALIVGLIFSIPIILITISPEGRTRANMTFFTKDFELFQYLHKSGYENIQSAIFDNNLVLSFNFWTKRYLEYFNLDYLFTNGMRFSIPNSPESGLLYLFELPFFLIGIVLLLFKNTFDPKTKKIIIFWFLIGPIAASLANNAQHPLRSLTMIPMPQLMSASGFYFVFKLFKNKATKKIFLVSMLGIVIFSLIYYSALYFVVYQKTNAEYLMDGWKQAAQYALNNQEDYDQIVIDPRFGTRGLDIVGIPYLYILFYGKIDPKEFQGDPRRLDWQTSVNFSKFTFREIDWANGGSSDNKKSKTLYIGSPWALPSIDQETLQKFYLINGKEILRAVTTKNNE